MRTTSQTLSTAGAKPIADLKGASRAQALHDRNLEFESLLARELPRFQRIAMRWLRNREDAEDAVQDAILSAFVHIASFEGRARMSSWLTAIVINSVKMHLRKKRRKLVPLDQLLEDGLRTVAEMIPDPAPNPEQNCRRSELHGILAHSVGKLSRAQRTALQLFELEGLSLKEVAEKIGVPVGTIKAQLARGRGRLRRKLHKVLGLRTTDPMRHTLERPSPRQVSEPLLDAPVRTDRREELSYDTEKTRLIREGICFRVMEVAVEGSPVPA